MLVSLSRSKKWHFSRDQSLEKNIQIFLTYRVKEGEEQILAVLLLYQIVESYDFPQIWVLKEYLELANGKKTCKYNYYLFFFQIELFSHQKRLSPIISNHA